MMHNVVALKLATVLAAVVLLGVYASASTADLEGFDDVEDKTPFVQPHNAFKEATEVVHEQEPVKDSFAANNAPQVEDMLQTAVNSSSKTSAYSAFRKPQTIKDIQMELVFGIFLVLYGCNVWVGRRTNSDLALQWARSFCGNGCVLDRNFAQIGTGGEAGKPILERVSNSDFKLYATGRRFCSHLSAKLSLRRRQDLLSLAWYSVQQRPDIVDLEIAMSEGAMPPMVLFIGQSKFAREWGSKEDSDLAVYAHTVEVSKQRLPQWPSDRLVVMAEHSSLLYDVMTESMMDQVFASPAFESVRKYFRYLLFTSEDPESQIPLVLRFSFALPPADKMDSMEKLMTAACAFIDIIGCYSSQFTQEQRKRAASKRSEAATKAKPSEESIDRVAALRSKKEIEEQEKLNRMTFQQREKYKEKKMALLRKRSVKMRKG